MSDYNDYWGPLVDDVERIAKRLADDALADLRARLDRRLADYYPTRPECLDDGEITVTDGPVMHIEAPPPSEPDTLHTGPSRAEVERLRAWNRMWKRKAKYWRLRRNCEQGITIELLGRLGQSRQDNDRLRALLQRWAKGDEGFGHWYTVSFGGTFTCKRCWCHGDLPEAIVHDFGCVVEDTLKELKG